MTSIFDTLLSVAQSQLESIKTTGQSDGAAQQNQIDQYAQMQLINNSAIENSQLSSQVDLQNFSFLQQLLESFGNNVQGLGDSLQLAQAAKESFSTSQTQMQPDLTQIFNTLCSNFFQTPFSDKQVLSLEDGQDSLAQTSSCTLNESILRRIGGVESGNPFESSTDSFLKGQGGLKESGPAGAVCMGGRYLSSQESSNDTICNMNELSYKLFPQTPFSFPQQENLQSSSPISDQSQVRLSVNIPQYQSIKSSPTQFCHLDSASLQNTLSTLGVQGGGVQKRCSLSRKQPDSTRSVFKNLISEELDVDNSPGKGVSGTSQYRGVSWHSQTGRWKAQIKVFGRDINLGRHRCEQDAAKAYDRAAICARGSSQARLNFPTETYQEEFHKLSSMSLEQLAYELRGVKQRLLAQTSQFHGVRLNKRTQKWEAYIRVAGKHIHLGCYDSELFAAKAYDQAAILRHTHNLGAMGGKPQITTNFELDNYQDVVRLLVEYDTHQFPFQALQSLEVLTEKYSRNVVQKCIELGGVFNVKQCRELLV